MKLKLTFTPFCSFTGRTVSDISDAIGAIPAWSPSFAHVAGAKVWTDFTGTEKDDFVADACVWLTGSAETPFLAERIDHEIGAGTLSMLPEWGTYNLATREVLFLLILIHVQKHLCSTLPEIGPLRTSKPRRLLRTGSP